MSARREALDAQFWARTDRSGECWLWTGKKLPKGYGQLRRDWRRHLP